MGVDHTADRCSDTSDRLRVSATGFLKKSVVRKERQSRLQNYPRLSQLLFLLLKPSKHPEIITYVTFQVGHMMVHKYGEYRSCNVISFFSPRVTFFLIYSGKVNVFRLMPAHYAIKVIARLFNVPRTSAVIPSRNQTVVLALRE